MLHGVLNELPPGEDSFRSRCEFVTLKNGMEPRITQPAPIHRGINTNLTKE